MDRPLCKLYTIALKEEADPLIHELALRRETTDGSLPVYRGEDTALIISGIGKVKAAAATACLFSRGDVSKDALAINFGIAGAVDPALSNTADLFLIHKIVDAGSGREFFPDMIALADIAETQVTTFDRPVSRESSHIPEGGLVDMEAAGFFETASLFVGPHRIACLKIVSDHLEGKKLDRNFIRSLAEQHGRKIASLASTLASQISCIPQALGEEEEKWIETLAQALRLTVSQTHLLRHRVLARRLGRNQPLPTLTEEWTRPVKTKAERNRRFAAIRKNLLQ